MSFSKVILFLEMLLTVWNVQAITIKKEYLGVGHFFDGGGGSVI